MLILALEDAFGSGTKIVEVERVSNALVGADANKDTDAVIIACDKTVLCEKCDDTVSYRVAVAQALKERFPKLIVIGMSNTGVVEPDTIGLDGFVNKHTLGQEPVKEYIRNLLTK